MATPSNHWKLGLFVVGGVVLALSAMLVFGARSLQKHTVDYKSYFDESVQGLEEGSPVKFRGVTIGTVGSIDVAPDRRHVEVTSALAIDEVTRMGLASGHGGSLRVNVPEDVRVQLVSAGITGVKFLQLDFFDLKANPPPALPFPTPPNYIPSAVSMMKNLEDSVVHAVNRIPEMTDAILLLLTKVDHALDDTHLEQLSSRTGVVLEKADMALTEMRATLHAIDPAKLSSKTAQTLDHLDATVTRLNSVLERVNGERGLLSNAERASEAMGDAVRNAGGLGTELQDTLQEVRSAAESIQKLSDALELDSDMLVKGRAKRVQR